MSSLGDLIETQPEAVSQAQSQAIYLEEGGERVLLYKPSDVQLAYHQCTLPNAIMLGNRGGGKSICGRWDCHGRALSYPGFKYVILRRTFPQLKSSHLDFIDREMRALGGYYHSTDKIAHYPNGSKGFFRQCDTEEAVLDLLSAEFHLMFFDELSTFPWEWFMKLATSVRVTKQSGLLAMVRGATNPLGESAEEINHYFVAKDVDPEVDADYNPDDWGYIKVQAEDNEHIDLNQYRKRFATMPEHVKRAWVDGEFMLANAMFDVRPTKKVVEEDGSVKEIPYHFLTELDRYELIKRAQIYRAYDHGYFPDPAVCLWIAHLGNRAIVFHEQLWVKTIAADIARDIRDITTELGIDRVVDTFCDPSIDLQTGADVHTIMDVFESNGVPMSPSANSRELYAAAIHAGLGELAAEHTPKLQVYVKGCPYLAKTLPKQRFDPKHALRMANHKDDHATIALAYYLISTGSLERKPMQAITTKRWMRPKASERWILGRENVRRGKYGV